MIISLHSEPLRLDSHAKELSRAARKLAEAVAHERVRKCNCAPYVSPFKDCPDCGSEFQKTQVQDAPDPQ
jgi:hypothetical protein